MLPSRTCVTIEVGVIPASDRVCQFALTIPPVDPRPQVRTTSPVLAGGLPLERISVMTQGESKLSRQIAKEVRHRGGFIFKVHGGPTMMAGLPDLQGCYRGRYVALETKMPGAKGASPVQRLRINQIRRAGGVSFVVRSVNDAMRVLDWVDRQIDSTDV